ncbi:MAG: dihydrodipicolinate synthase family protein, partial [Acidimicrobiales bacterium]
MDTPLLHGVCAAMGSPFDDTGELLDEGRLRDHIESLIDAGVHGLVLCAGTGEFAFLSTEEKDRMIGLGCEIVDGRVPVIAQTSAITTTDAIERTRKAADQGASAAMVLPPYFEGPFERGVLFHYEKLAQAIDIPIVLYNIPAATGFDIHPDLYRQLLAMENIDYIKESTGDLIRLQKVVGIGDGRCSRMDLGGGQRDAPRVRDVVGPHPEGRPSRGARPLGQDASGQHVLLGKQCRRRIQLGGQDGYQHGRSLGRTMSSTGAADDSPGPVGVADCSVDVAGERNVERHPRVPRVGRRTGLARPDDTHLRREPSERPIMTFNFDPVALAASVTPSTRLVIGGRSVESASGATFATVNPATGQELAQVSEGTAQDMDRAVAAARDAFDNGPWGRMSPADRRGLLKRFALLVEAHADELALLESLEAGKPIFDTSTIDLPET